MKRRSNWKSVTGILVVMAIMVSMVLVPAVKAEGTTQNSLVNINKADTGELTSLPGIGTSKASAIVKYRSDNGPFSTVDELIKVPGIGDNILEKIRGLIMAE